MIGYLMESNMTMEKFYMFEKLSDIETGIYLDESSYCV